MWRRKGGGRGGEAGEQQIRAPGDPYFSFSSSSFSLCIRRGFDKKFRSRQRRTGSLKPFLFVYTIYVDLPKKTSCFEFQSLQIGTYCTSKYVLYNMTTVPILTIHLEKNVVPSCSWGKVHFIYLNSFFMTLAAFSLQCWEKIKTTACQKMRQSTYYAIFVS